ncbi:MAG: hypothetical protein ACT4PO_15880 [Actinomycetota bacterium]
MEDGTETHYSVVLPHEVRAEERRLNILYKGTITVVRTFDLPTLGRVLLGELESLSFPSRDDAVFVNASTARTDDATVLIPAPLVHHLTRLRRHIERAGISVSPAQSVAVQLESGRLTPIVSRLDVPSDALDRLRRLAPTNGGADASMFVERSLDVDAVCWFAEVDAPPLEPMSRALTLHHLATEAVNLRTMGGVAIEGLRRLVQRARCYGLGGDDARDMLEALGRILRSDRS